LKILSEAENIKNVISLAVLKNVTLGLPIGIYDSKKYYLRKLTYQKSNYQEIL